MQPAYTTATINVTQSGTWSVITTRPGCSDMATDDVIVAFSTPPVLNQPPNIIAPAGACDPIFNLNSVIAAMVSPGLPSDYNVLFYLDVVDSWDGNGNIISPANAYTTNTTTTIYVRVENILNPTCSEFTEFDVVVDCVPTPCNVTSLTSNSPICANDNAEFYLVGTPGATVSYTINGGVYFPEIG